MGGPDDDRFEIGEQHGRAVGGEDTEQQVGRVGDHRIGAGALVLRPRLVRDHDVGGMDLVDGRELGAGQKRAKARRRLPAIASRSSLLPKPTLSPAHSPTEMPPRRPRKPWGSRPRLTSADDFDALRATSRMMISSSAWLPTMKP